MRLHIIRSFALSLPHTTVIKQWGEHLVFKVAGKMFLIIGLDGEVIDGLTIKPAGGVRRLDRNRRRDAGALLRQAPLGACRRPHRPARRGTRPPHSPQLQLVVAKLPKTQAKLRQVS